MPPDRLEKACFAHLQQSDLLYLLPPSTLKAPPPLAKIPLKNTTKPFLCNLIDYNLNVNRGFPF